MRMLRIAKFNVSYIDIGTCQPKIGLPRAKNLIYNIFIFGVLDRFLGHVNMLIIKHKP